MSVRRRGRFLVAVAGACLLAVLAAAAATRAALTRARDLVTAGASDEQIAAALDVVNVRLAVVAAATVAALGLLIAIVRRIERSGLGAADPLPLRTDPLTGTATRPVLTERLELAIAGAQRTDRRVGVMFVDLDGFKLINDTYGHDAGDRVLVTVAERLEQSARRTDLVARYGGDEFVVVVDHLDDASGAAVMARKLLDTLCVPIGIGDDVRFTPRASVGIAIYPDDTASSPEELVRLADAAMYEAKRSGGNAYQFSTEELRDAEARRRASIDAIRDALELGEIVLRFEPQHDLMTGEVVAAEALVRWERDDGTTVTADEFLDLTEHTELAVTIGTWVLDEALSALAKWRSEGLTSLIAHINLGSRSLRDGRPAAQLEDLLRLHDIPPRAVAIEVAELVLVSDPQRISRTLGEIAALGVQLVLDEFGTGLSSLARMAELPLDALKLDEALVERLGTPDDEVVAGIVGLARELDLEVIAAHVSLVGQLSRARELGVLRAQGPLLSEPMQAEELMTAVRRQRTRR